MPVASTSRAAHTSILVTDLEDRVLDVIKGYGAFGCISDEVREAYPELSYSSVTARFAALEEKGEIFRAGDTRAGKSGRQQKVMRAAMYSAGVPIVVPSKKGKRNPFLAGMMFAAKLVASAADFDTAKNELKRELLKVASK